MDGRVITVFVWIKEGLVTRLCHDEVIEFHYINLQSDPLIQLSQQHIYSHPR